ncbi:MAG TPA: hypothetical protein VN719_15310 [Gemmatimonadales bacterium]|nr:hypothetical protein [Gemmatimonadales bacterium]
MARKSKDSAPPEGGAESPVPDLPVADPFWGSFREAQTKKTGASLLVTTDEARKMAIGLPFPSFALEFLFQSNVFLLSRFYRFVGEPDNYKSTGLYEVIRWFLICAGYSIFGENENKDTSHLRAAILEQKYEWIGDAAKPEFTPACLAGFTHSMEEWQGLFANTIAAVTNRHEGKARPADADDSRKHFVELAARFAASAKKQLAGWDVPYILGLDSLTGTEAVKVQEQMQSDGHASLGFSTLANLISRYLGGMPRLLRNTSITLVATNHVKPQLDKFGNQITHTTGGRAPKFYETCELQFTREKSQFSCAGLTGNEVLLQMVKNGLGEGEKQIKVPVVSLSQAQGSEQLLLYRGFHWPLATANLLLDAEKIDAARTRVLNKSHWDVIREITGARLLPRKQVWSERLGIPEHRPASYAAFGRRIDADLQLRHELRQALGITTRTVYRPGTPLLVQVRRAAEGPDPNLYWDPYRTRDVSHLTWMGDAAVELGLIPECLT